MKFRIETKPVHGHPRTTVYNAETGEEFKNLLKVCFEHEAHGLPVLTLVILCLDESVEILGETPVVIEKHP